MKLYQFNIKQIKTCELVFYEEKVDLMLKLKLKIIIVPKGKLLVVNETKF